MRLKSAGDLQSDFDERFEIYSSDLGPGNRLAAEVLPDRGNPRGKPGIMPGATLVTSMRLRLRKVMRATPDSRGYAVRENASRRK
jgi:hypothetical protein